MIEATYQESIETTIEQASQTTQRIEEATNEKEGEQQPDLLTTLQNLPNAVTENLTKWVDEAKESLNGFIEALAVMVVTSCIIPILVLVFFLWLIKTILGVQIEAPMRMIYPRTLRHIKRRGPKK
jgi:predicted PurR-regulated permease PerM